MTQDEINEQEAKFLRDSSRNGILLPHSFSSELETPQNIEIEIGEAKLKKKLEIKIVDIKNGGKESAF